MPGWLQAFARNQPVSVTVYAVRSLSEGGPAAHYAWQTGAWIVGFVVVFGWLAVRVPPALIGRGRRAKTRRNQSRAASKIAYRDAGVVER